VPIGALTFLAVEDHAFQRTMLLKMLAGLGVVKVSEAADGHAALEIFAGADPPVDIIISDLDMPGMDGMEFVRHLGASGKPVSIILASSLEPTLLSSVEAMARAYGVRILGVIEKPITPAKLDALIRLHEAIQPVPSPVSARSPTFTLDEIEAGLAYDEFEPFFQPKVELVSGRLHGAEALARWRNPKEGIVSPGAFIALMEENNLIDGLMWTMLRKSAAFCGRWRAACGLDVSVSVNLSAKSLVDEHLAERVVNCVRGEGLEPQYMILEITESAATTNVGQALENLSRLRMKGFGLSIDDFGTGYSSMQQLMRIAFTELKIDQSFVANAARNQAARIILESSLDMARKLDITSVAEGVESKEDWKLLRQLGCQLAQGYFIAKPMEASALLKRTQDPFHVEETESR
jgi:EAL domain-containing protein (putative c-di-GMP-specific phosphodiesterase class I)